MARRTAGAVGEFFQTYTRDVTRDDVRRLFTRDTRDAYRFFASRIREEQLADQRGLKRFLTQIRLFFLAFTLRLSPARRVLYGVALGVSVLGTLQLFRGFSVREVPIGPIWVPMPLPTWAEGTVLLVIGVVLLNLLILLEVADRLSLKNDLDIARAIQQAMLPTDTERVQDTEIHGLTRPANTVGGDFYDIQPTRDGRILIAVGDVAGKGSPAALLMALLLAMMRALLEEYAEPAPLVARLNTQVLRHAPPSRFITLFVGLYHPTSGDLVYVNAGHMPPLLQRASGTFDRLIEGGVALGMLDGSTFDTGVARIDSGDRLVLYSDGITEAESTSGRFFDEAGLMRVLSTEAGASASRVCQAVLQSVVSHVGDSRLTDDLTVLVLRRLPTAA